MDTPAFRRHALIPKVSTSENLFRFVPALPQDDVAELYGALAPPERRALAQIVETADLALLDGVVVLVVPTTPALLDTLAAFQASQEDREYDLEDEEEQDDDYENDNAFDVCWRRGYMEPVTDDYEPEDPFGDKDTAPEMWGECSDQPAPDTSNIPPVTTMPEPPPIASHARPAEFAGDTLPVLASNRYTGQLRVMRRDRTTGTEREAELVPALDENGRIFMAGRRA